MAEWFTYTGPTTITSRRRLQRSSPATDYYVLNFGYADGASYDRTDQTQVHYRSGGRSHGQHLRLRHFRRHGARSALQFRSNHSDKERPLHLGHRHRPPNINTAATPRASRAIWPTTSKARSTTSSPRRRRSFRSSACAATSGSTMSSSNPPRPTTCGRPASTPQAMPQPHRR